VSNMQVNDFVTIQYNTYKSIAYIVELTESHCKVVKVYFEYPTGKRVHYTSWKEEEFQLYGVEPMETKLDEEDIQVLINLSLASWDKDWFEELMRG
jgi:hypothetical protein